MFLVFQILNPPPPNNEDDPVALTGKIGSPVRNAPPQAKVSVSLFFEILSSRINSSLTKTILFQRRRTTRNAPKANVPPGKSKESNQEEQSQKLGPKAVGQKVSFTFIYNLDMLKLRHYDLNIPFILSDCR